MKVSKLAAGAIATGLIALFAVQNASAWWGGGDRWGGNRYYDSPSYGGYGGGPGYWGGYPGYGHGGYPYGGYGYGGGYPYGGYGYGAPAYGYGAPYGGGYQAPSSSSGGDVGRTYSTK